MSVMLWVILIASYIWNFDGLLTLCGTGAIAEETIHKCSCNGRWLKNSVCYFLHCCHFWYFWEECCFHHCLSVGLLAGWLKRNFAQLCVKFAWKWSYRPKKSWLVWPWVSVFYCNFRTSGSIWPCWWENDCTDQKSFEFWHWPENWNLITVP